MFQDWYVVCPVKMVTIWVVLLYKLSEYTTTDHLDNHQKP